MSKFLLGLFLIAVLTPSSGRGAQPQSNDGNSLASFLATRGFAAARLKRLPRNGLGLPVTINQKSSALLLVATACPISGVDRGSAQKWGLVSPKADVRVKGTLGLSNERYGIGELKSLALPSGVLTNVRVAFLNLSNLNLNRTQAHIDGLFGYSEMRRLGAVLDCARQTLYLNPLGASGGATAKLRQYLVERGFTRIPMREDSEGHFEVDCKINGRISRMTVDTAAAFTCINQRTAAKAGMSAALTSLSAQGAGNRSASVSSGRAKEFTIGNFKITNAGLAVVNVSYDSLGIEHLSLNSAVIDIKGASLYLRHPGKR